MTRQKLITILGAVLAFACVANAGFAQTQATTTNGTQTSGDRDQSAAAMAQEAANPFSSRWLMQMQQNNNWMDMPLESGNRMQSNVMFQPLLSVALSDKWGLYIRPVVTMVNSLPHLDQNGQSERTNGFGDTVVGVAAAHPLFGGRLVLGAGPTFAFPTASERELGQDTWQIGPDVGATLLGKNFIAYAFVQQWFKVGGDGRKTNQMNAVFNYTHAFTNGWTIGTQPNLSVDWEARDGDRVAFAVGPQVGRMCKCGGTPTLFQLQFQYYPVRPSAAGPRWNVQLQVTPTISALVKKTLF
jgi:Putative MetA-pathway of phenol degradation